MQLHNQNKNNF